MLVFQSSLTRPFFFLSLFQAFIHSVSGENQVSTVVWSTVFEWLHSKWIITIGIISVCEWLRNTPAWWIVIWKHGDRERECVCVVLMMLTDILSKLNSFSVSHIFGAIPLGIRKVQAKLLWMQCISFFRLWVSLRSALSRSLSFDVSLILFLLRYRSQYLCLLLFLFFFLYIYLFNMHFRNHFFSIITTKYFPRNKKKKQRTVSCTDCNIMLKYWKLCAK